MNIDMFVHNVSEDQSSLWWEFLGDLQICLILNFKIHSLTEQFVLNLTQDYSPSIYNQIC